MVCKSWLLSAFSVLIVLTVAVALYALGVTPGHVAVLLHRARKQLEACMQQTG